MNTPKHAALPGIMIFLLTTGVFSRAGLAQDQKKEPLSERSKPQAAASQPDAIAEINGMLDRIERAYQQHDAQALGKMYCDEGFLVIAAPVERAAGAIVAGKQDILEHLPQRWSQTKLQSHRFVKRDIGIRGDTACLTLEIVERFAEQPERTDRVQALAVRGSDGWKMCFGLPELARLVVLVTDVQAGSSAAAVGVKAGDEIIWLGGEAVRSIADLEQRAKVLLADAVAPSDKKAMVVVRRGGDQLRFELPLSSPLGLQCEERLLPAGDAVLVDSKEPHQIKELMREELEARKAGDVQRLIHMQCPSGFLGLLPEESKPLCILDTKSFRDAMQKELPRFAATVDWATARYEGVRLLVSGDVALASNRFSIVKRGEKPEKMVQPSLLEVYVRQNGQWWLAAVLPWRIEIGTHLWALAVRTAEETANLEAGLRGEYAGLGIGCESTPDGLRITKVYPNSGAEEAGLREGDIIVKADGRPMNGLTTENAIQLLKGAEGSTVKLDVRSRGKQDRVVTVTRKSFIVSGVAWRMLPDKIGLLELKGFNQHTVEEARAALAEFTAQGSIGLVLDLRGNVGGLTGEMKGTAELFIPAGKTLWYERPVGGDAKPIKAGGQVATGLPMVVLVDSRTAGGELIAAALKINKRGTVVGQRTPGLSAGKEMVKRPDGGSELVHRSDYLITRKKLITGRGVDPNVAMPPDASPQEVLDKALTILKAKINEPSARQTKS